MAAPDLATAGPMPPETSRDLFYRGRFALLQPTAGGFRAGLDALLLAATLPEDRGGRVADLGAGAGAVGLAVACRCPDAAVTLVENDPAMAALARTTFELAENAALAPRLTLVEADVLGGRALREAAGLCDGAFETVATNPPFHPASGRASPDALRRAAVAMPGPDFLPRWLAVAAALAAPGCLLAAILRPDNLAAVFAAAENRFGDIRLRPVHASADRRAIRILVQARKGSRAPFLILPPIVLHEADGRPTASGTGIGEGTLTIDFAG